jgi:hypothetical protein
LELIVIEGLWGLSRHDCPTFTTRGGTNTGAVSNKPYKFLVYLREAESNEFRHPAVYFHMKAMLLPALLSFALATASPAQTCREVVRDSSGRVVQTIERQKQAGGTERAVIRDASGRITGTATTQPTGGNAARTTYRDASGKLTGSAVTLGTASGSSRTTYRDANGRMTGSADTSKVAGSGSRTQFRDASGRAAGTETTSGHGATRRDPSGRVTGSSTGSGKCPTGTRVPLLPTGQYNK